MRTEIFITSKAADRRRLKVLARDRNAPHKSMAGGLRSSWGARTVLAPMRSCAGPAIEDLRAMPGTLHQAGYEASCTIRNAPGASSQYNRATSIGAPKHVPPSLNDTYRGT